MISVAKNVGYNLMVILLGVERLSLGPRLCKLVLKVKFSYVSVKLIRKQK